MSGGPGSTLRAARARRGARAHLSGLAAEEAVAEHYARAGRPVAARRWRGREGEIDLVARDGEGYIFVEVKRARSFAEAAERVTPRQIGRILAAALEFLIGNPRGMNVEMRFDVALVDGAGRISIVENAFGA